MFMEAFRRTGEVLRQPIGDKSVALSFRESLLFPVIRLIGSVSEFLACAS